MSGKNKFNEWVKSKSTMIRVAVGLCIAVAFYWVLSNIPMIGQWLHTLWRILRPFFYGIAIAYLLRPLARRIEKWMLKVKFLKKHTWGVRVVSVFIAIAFGIAVVVLLIAMIIPQVIDSLQNLIATFPDLMDNTVNRIIQYTKKPETASLIQQLYENFSLRADDIIKNLIMPNIEQISASIGNGAVVAAYLIVDVIIGFVAATYILVDRTKLKHKCKRIVGYFFTGRRYERIVDECRYADTVFNGFINGKIVDSIVVGLICYIFCAITGMPNALLVSVVIGVTNIIPVFGPFIGAIPSAFIILAYSPIKCLWFILFILALQTLDGHIIGPKIIGQSTGISGFWVLFAIVFFGGLFGITGMIIGVPLLAVIFDICKKLDQRKEAERAAEREKEAQAKTESTTADAETKYDSESKEGE